MLTGRLFDGHFRLDPPTRPDGTDRSRARAASELRAVRFRIGSFYLPGAIFKISVERSNAATRASRSSNSSALAV
jgi:hypothetical protein